MKVGYCQFSPLFGEKEKSLSRALGLLEQSSATLMVLPELFSTGYYFCNREEVMALAEEIPGGATSKALQTFCAIKGIYLIAGIAEREGDRLYNSAALFGPAGHMLTYRKLHLFNEEKNLFSPGNYPLKVVEVEDLRVGIMICYDWIYPEAARVLALLGADAIGHPANLVLPYCPAVMQARSIENKVYSITANRTGTDERCGKKLRFIGKSQIIDPAGAVMVQAGEDEETTGEAEISPACARNKKILEFNDLFEDRRISYYLPLVQHHHKEE